MELNAAIQHTALTPEGIYVACTLAYQGKDASCMFPLEPTFENITEILKICGKNSWEQLIGAPVKLRVETEGDKAKVVAIGHFLADYWLDIPEPKETPEAEKESE